MLSRNAGPRRNGRRRAFALGHTALALAAAFAAGLALPPAPSRAAEVRGARLPGVRPLGMGDSFVAVADDRNALHTNPAGLASLRRWSLSGLGVSGGVDDRFFDAVHFIQGNEDAFADADLVDQEFVDSLAPFDDRWVATDATAYADFTRPGFGIGAYSAARLQLKIDRGVYEPRVRFAVSDDIVGIAGGAMDLGRGDLLVGASLKGIWRRESTRELTAREIADFDAGDVLDELEVADAGFALDLGVIRRREDSRLSLGAVVRDLGVIAGETIDAAVDLGAAFRAYEGPGIVKSVLLAADASDVFDGGVAAGNRLHLGAELRVPVLSLRGGFNQGYPSFGATFDARVLVLDYAYFGRELGEFPGSEGQYLHALEARLGF